MDWEIDIQVDRRIRSHIRYTDRSLHRWLDR